MRSGLVAFAAVLSIALLWPAITRGADSLRGDTGNSASAVYFVDATAWSGLGATQHSCPHESEERYFVTGQAWGDADGDGVTDLYLTSQCGPNSLYLGYGNGQFHLAPFSDQVALADRRSGGALFADFDNDGSPDLLVLTHDGPVFFRNQKGKGFVDATAASGMRPIAGGHPITASAADFDQDGLLDLFIANYGCNSCLPGPRDEVQSQLFRNRGDGRFEDVSPALGGEGPMGFSFVARWVDFDNDGDQDLYITNDVRGGRTLQGDVLYRNDGPGCGGRCFVNASEASGTGVRADAMGVAVADFDGNGALDLFITNSGWAYTELTGPAMLLAGGRDGTFHDTAEQAGAAVDAMAWGAAALDVNNDGQPDLYVALGTDPAGVGDQWVTTNRLLLNTGRGRFRDVSKQGRAADIADSFGVAVGDANGDGQPDIVVGDYAGGKEGGYRIYLGTGGGAGSGNRLVVRLTGGEGVNRDAVGSRIEAVLSDGRRLIHEVSLGGTTGGNDETTFRTGTGAATVVQLSVRWPDGYNQVAYDIPADSEVRWTYRSEPRLQPLRPIAAYAEPVAAEAEVAGGMPRMWLLGLALVGALALSPRPPLPLRRARGRTPPPAPSPFLRNGEGETIPAHSARIGRAVRVRGRVYPVLLPNWRDPRLHVAAVISSLQVLGQTVLGFDLSIAQILVSLLTCGLIEFAITFRRDGTLAWPASALLTGNGVAFILRVPGTEHGDWWSLNGWYIYSGVAAGSLLSKYLIRSNGRHVFNPSNIGLVLAFLLLGSDRVEPLDFWWGPISQGTGVAIGIIALGALVILVRLRLLAMAGAFWFAFAGGVGVVALAGHCMSARWSFDPVCGGWFWWVLVSSPELLIFMFYMMTDPKTIPEGRVARIVFGAAVGFAAVVFIAPQQTEYSSKVAVLASLAVVCAIRPYLERLCPAPGSERDNLRAWLIGRGSFAAHRRAPALTPGVLRGAGAVAVVAVWLGSLIPLGVPARLPLAEARTGDTVVGRPAIAIDRATLPAVVIDPGFERLDATVTQADADRIAEDVAADLKIEAIALTTLDGELAKTAATGVRLQALLSAIADGRQAGRVTITTHTFESMKLRPVYDSANAQAGPVFGLEVHGKVHRVTSERDSRVVGEEDTAYERTFALLKRNGKYLIAADFASDAP